MTKFSRVSETRVQTDDGRVFDLIGQEPYRRKDGAQTNLLVWGALCEVCASPFQARTPEIFETTKAFGARHCDAHRLSSAQVKDRLQAARRAKAAPEIEG